MTDKEKIEQIIKDKNLNNSQFCNMVGIAPGTLSHIISGRTNPTLNILRSIKFVFPDINPAWLFFDEGPMYEEESSDPTPKDTDAEMEDIDNDEVLARSADYYQPDLFGPQPRQMKASASGSGTSGNTPQHPAMHSANTANSPSGASPIVPNMAPVSPLDVAGIVEETVKQLHRPQRKVVEVRIFFDDGTFETFGS